MSASSQPAMGSGRCARCGSPLAAERVEGLCPACIWSSLSRDELAEPADVETSKLSNLLQIPGYEVIQEISHGGMGIVYRARQLQLNRTVALKMLLPHHFGTTELRERFRIEARAMAALEHPAILPVYEVGDYRGTPFFSMKLAGGGSLAARATQLQGRFREMAELLHALADAVHFAHEHGVLHRDLKPGNILFDEVGCPYVSDFGLAKVAGFESDLTQTTDVLGTPHYMAPEVAASSARQATTASDVYSLGAILYELLANRPPHTAEGIPALLRKIAEEEPPPLQPGVPRDLEVICRKALAKSPSRRYASAREFSEDLRRWLAGEAILARPVSRLEKVWRWTARNPLSASALAALALFLAIAGALLWRSDRAVRRALGTTQRAQQEAQQHLWEALVAQSRAIGSAHSVGQRWDALAALAQAARIRGSLEVRSEAAAVLARPDLREVRRFRASFGEAGSPIVFTSDLGQYVTPELQGGFSLRKTEDQSVVRSFPGALGKPARWFVLSHNDRYLAALLDDYSLEVWDLAAGTKPTLRWSGTVQQPPVAAFHPNGTSLAAFTPGTGLFMQNLDGSALVPFRSTGGRAVYLRFDPNGERLAVVRDPGGVEVWNCRSSPELVWTHPLRRAVPWVSWSPDGSGLAVAADDGRGIRILDTRDGEIELVYSRHLLYPRQFEFAPNGRIVASVGQDWALRLWDVHSGQDLVQGTGRHRVMRFSADGRYLTTAPADGELSVLELAPDQVFREFASKWPGGEIAPSGLASTTDGGLLLVANAQPRLYDTTAGKQVATMHPDSLVIDEHAFLEASPPALLCSSRSKGTVRHFFTVATNSRSGKIEIQWNSEKQLAPPGRESIFQTTEGGTTWVWYSDDGVEIWPDQSPEKAHRVGAHGFVPNVSTSGDARWAAQAFPEENRIEIWDFGTGKVCSELRARAPQRVWFSPDSRWLVASDLQGYSVWRTERWELKTTWTARLDSGDPGEVTFTRDGRMIAARDERERFKLLSFPDCQTMITLEPPLVINVRNALFSPDGTRLWLLANGFRVFEWNLAALRAGLGKLGLDWTGVGLPPVLEGTSH